MTEAVLYAAVLALQYAACVSLYHAEPRRTEFAELAGSALQQFALRSFGWFTLFVTVLVLCWELGAERGITIALGAIGIAGLASLFVKAYAPNKHTVSGIAALISSIAMGLLLITKVS